MKLVIQRVSAAAVRVNGELVGSIDRGFVILVGVTHDDTEAEAQWLAHKVTGLRVFEDDDGKFNLSLQEVQGSALVISQFTLYGDSRKGRRPSFTHAARPEKAAPLIDSFSEFLQAEGVPVETGIFGAYMKVEIHNDGPVTLILEKSNC